jgi:Asp-tRNA(Asn)/Glu-tRNA(Gln) amidotransferase A subunit family amidase
MIKRFGIAIVAACFCMMPGGSLVARPDAAVVQGRDGLALDTGAVVIGDATIGLLRVTTQGHGGRIAAGFGLTGRDGRYDSLTPVVIGDVVIARTIRTAPGNQVHIVDIFQNFGKRPASLFAEWGSYLPSLTADPRAIALAERSFLAREPEIHVDFGDRMRGQWTDFYPVTSRAQRTYPGADPAYLGYRMHLSIEPGHQRAIGTTINLAAPDWSWLSPSVRRSLANRSSAKGSARLLPAGSLTITGLQLAKEKHGLLASDILRHSLAQIARIDRHGPQHRAIMTVNPAAFAEADAVDARIMSGQSMPFAGIPFAVKDMIDVAGLPTSLGMPPLAATPVKQDAPVVRALRAQGMILIGKTNLGEDLGEYGVSRAGGRTVGTVHPDLTVSGSSGGSAVAVASGIVAFALGSDTCGSISAPASYAGIFGLRPSLGAIDYTGTRPLTPDYDTIGPMTGDARDAALLVQLLARDATGGPSPGDPLRLGIVRSLPANQPPMAPMIAQRLTENVARLSEAGITFVDIAMPEWEARAARVRSLDDPYASKVAMEAYLARRGDGWTIATLADHGGLMSAERQGLRALAEAHPAPGIAGARRGALAAVRAYLETILDENGLDALVLPATTSRPGVLDVTRHGLGYEPSPCIYSAMSGLPQFTIPLPAARGQPPLGLNIIGRFGSDRTVVAIGEQLIERLSRPSR